MPVPPGSETVTYRAIVDGFEITRVCIPRNFTQNQRDEVRSEIARNLGIPRHYIRLRAVDTKED